MSFHLLDIASIKKVLACNGKELKKEYIHTHTHTHCLNTSAVHLKLTQHCKWTIFQLKNDYWKKEDTHHIPPFISKGIRFGKVKWNLLKVIQLVSVWTYKDSRTGLCDSKTNAVQYLSPLHEIKLFLPSTLFLMIFNLCINSGCLYLWFEPCVTCLASVE